MRPFRIILFIATLAAGCLTGSPTAGAAGALTGKSARQVQPEVSRNCPSRDDLETALSNASSLIQQSRYQDAAALIQALSGVNCDPRVSLLLAAAVEGEGDELQARSVLQHAHFVWPSNNSVAASLAREYLAGGDKDRAAKALAYFHATAGTSEQELEMAVVVYIEANQLRRAETIAAEDYKYHPSLHSLLLLANAMQLEGRYPDVNRLLGGKRQLFARSPEFLVTLAESEFDASIYGAARKDLERAIALDPRLYQAHYLLGNVLSKMSDADGAIAEYRKAIDLAPEQPRTWYQLALVLRSKQDHPGEQTALEQALKADGHYAPAQYELGRILLDEDHRPADAVNHLLLAIQYNPRAEEAYFLLARAYSQLGEREKANEIAQRLVAVRKENRPALGGENGNHSTVGKSTGP